MKFFNEKDRNSKFIEAIDRYGKKERFPLTSLSIAGVYSEFNQCSNPEEVGVYVAKIKKEVKIVGSSYLIKQIN